MNVAIFAFIIDTIIGDPRSRFHPGVLIGKLISFLERIYYREEDSDQKKFFCGAILVLLVLFITYDVAAGIIYLSYSIPWEWGTMAVEALLLAFTISPKSLAKAGRGIYALLLTNELDKARKAVGWIVGRDTAKLDESEVARATVETIAENTVDGVIAPLFFFMLGGVPLAVLYRAANTMDSMIGYKNERYRWFGTAAARLDDLVNFVPARLAGLLMVAAAGLCRFDAANAWRIFRRDRLRHASPNSAHAEAACAGALRVQLAGPASYGGQVEAKPFLGAPLSTVETADIARSHKLLFATAALSFFFALALRLLIVRGFRY